MTFLRTDQLTVGYDHQSVIENITIESLRGQILCLLGPNGAGKTTILRSLAGLLDSVSGAIYIGNQSLEEISAKTLAQKLSIVLTDQFDGGMMTVFEIASMGRYPYTDFLGQLSAKDIQLTLEALETVHASHLVDRYYSELSDGEKQKVQIARALVQEPELIILDEPTSHLDIKHRLELMEILQVLTKEKQLAVILSLHEIDLALKSSDQVLLVGKGEVQAYGAPEEVVDEALLSKLYDLESSSYNQLLGSIELYNTHSADVFVIGGGGLATPLYRLLTKNGIGFMTGVLFTNDIDYEVARTMGVDLISTPPFEPIEDDATKQALSELSQMRVLIETPIPYTSQNHDLRQIVEVALEQELPIFSLRDRQELYDLYGSSAQSIHHCSTYAQLLTEIESYL